LPVGWAWQWGPQSRLHREAEGGDGDADLDLRDDDGGGGGGGETFQPRDERRDGLEGASSLYDAVCAVGLDGAAPSR